MNPLQETHRLAFVDHGKSDRQQRPHSALRPLRARDARESMATFQTAFQPFPPEASPEGAFAVFYAAAAYDIALRVVRPEDLNTPETKYFLASAALGSWNLPEAERWLAEAPAAPGETALYHYLNGLLALLKQSPAEAREAFRHFRAACSDLAPRFQAWADDTTNTLLTLSLLS